MKRFTRLVKRKHPLLEVSVVKDPLDSDLQLTEGVDDDNDDDDNVEKDDEADEADDANDHANAGNGLEVRNKCPHFEDQRDVPFVSVVMGNGLFAFPSDDALKAFRLNHRRLDTVSDEEALGFPFLHATRPGFLKSMTSHSAPVMKIQRYAVVDIGVDTEVEDHYCENEHCRQVAASGNLRVFCLDFCQVFQHMDSTTSQVEYRFVFSIDNKSDHNRFTVRLSAHVMQRNCDAIMDGIRLRWHGTSGLSFLTGTGEFQLRVLDDDMPSFADYATESEYNKACTHAHPLRTVSQLPVWGSYSDKRRSIVPKKRTFHRADFHIQEKALCGKGLRNIPRDTLVLTSMCLFLHEIECSKDKRSSTSFGGPGFPMMV
ncbi:uncharacterized protein LALA0_S02e04214g [Lachancea lanzarotensis]|uniref:LALA0S02e04214g1_1 n=1 Tax=Lachancea lanzarotensis TaxID=1245769 RepID=A0A0C7N348_9SACH|nr:uncharacterized protein LALA0_S02e04214g [Lachancea lanzarotensis]CEP60987.1 LALA0S02e04214g1_1 [Lachancea lanzarotensis]